MRRSPKVLCAVLLGAACVSYDPTGPHAAAINGTFAARLVTVVSNDLETREDTSSVTLVLRDSVYRGRFYGFYRFADGDSGFVAGTLHRDLRVEVNQFGLWPPLRYVFYLHRLYPTCDFPSLGPVFILNGRMRGDTLLVEAETTLPCSERETQFTFALRGVRG